MFENILFYRESVIDILWTSQQKSLAKLAESIVVIHRYFLPLMASIAITRPLHLKHHEHF